jgi:glutamate-5-semialdehyde dehydrogenase
MNIKKQLEKIKKATREMAFLENIQINEALKSLANNLRLSSSLIISENQKDLDKMDQNNPNYDRLLLDDNRIESMASDIEKITDQASPLAKVLDRKTLDNGLDLEKVSVPLGTVGVIYEARPNVTIDVFALCLKSGNTCILKGGSDAEKSNQCLVQIIRGSLEQAGLNSDIIQLLPSDRQAAIDLMHAEDYVDVLIPRGSQNLINSVRTNSKVPVIETGAGIVHTYFDKDGDLEKGKQIILNAKTRRVSVCNALDCLIVHQNRLADLPELIKALESKDVQIYADESAYTKIKGEYAANLLYLANADSFGTEFLSHKLSIKTVDSFQDALDHIHLYSSKHSEAIISENKDKIKRFFKGVDAAVVYSNTSTAFTDGAQFGLGAEIGISTQKLHARGPMGLQELCSYKWLIQGKGQIRL